MRSRVSITVFLILAAFACSSLFLSLAQTGPALYEFTVYASYQFNTLRKPTGIVNLASGLFISDSDNHVIRKFDGATLTTVAGEFAAGYVDGAPLSSRFNYPTGIWGKYNRWGCARCPQGQGAYTTLSVIDSSNLVVRGICLGSTGNSVPCNRVYTAAGSGSPGLVDGPSLSASFRAMGATVPLNPTSSDAQYLVDTENHVVRSWDGSNVTTFAGTGAPGFVNGPRTSAQFFLPGKVAKDANGNMYVPDQGNHVIRKIDTAGNVTTFAGSPSGEPGYANGTGTAARFSRPSTAVFDGSCSCLYVTDAGNNSIRKVTLSGIVTTYAGAQQGGLVNGSLSQARFTSPMDLAIHGGNIMYVADTLNNSIRRIDMSAGVVSTYIN